MVKYGIYYDYWKHDSGNDFERFIKKYNDYGFEVMEIDAFSAINLTKKEIIELKKCADYYGIYITIGVGFPPELDMARDNLKIQREATKVVTKIIDTMVLLGSRELAGLVHTAWNPLIENDLPEKRGKYIERSLKNMKEVVKYLEDYGIVYHVETLNRFEQYMLNTIEETIDYIEQLGSPNVKILADVFHLNIEENDMVVSIKGAGKHIGYFHLGENNRDMPGNGNMDWDGISEALKSIEFDGCIVLEPCVVSEGSLARSFRIWRNLINSTDEASLDQYALKGMEFVKEKFK